MNAYHLLFTNYYLPSYQQTRTETVQCQKKWL